MTWVGLILAICVAIVWGNAYAYGGLGKGGWELQGILGLQVFLLGFIGGYQISSATGAAREIGIFEYHRVSPLPPSWIASGFFLGGPDPGISPGGPHPAVRLCLLGLDGDRSARPDPDRDPDPARLLAPPCPVPAHAAGGEEAQGLWQGGVLGMILLGMFTGMPIVSGIGWVVQFLFREEGESIFAFFGVPVYWLVFIAALLGDPAGLPGPGLRPEGEGRPGPRLFQGPGDRFPGVDGDHGDRCHLVVSSAG